MIKDLELSFEIINYHYQDLEPRAFDEGEEAALTSQLHTTHGAASELGHRVSLGETVASTVIRVFERVIAEGFHNHSRAKNATDKAKEAGRPRKRRLALLNPSKKEKNETALPAKLPEPEVNVYVMFYPGFTRPWEKVTFLQLGTVLGSMVKVIFMDKPTTGMTYLERAKKILAEVQMSGLLTRRLRAALFQATGMMPKLTGVKQPIKNNEMKQFGPDTCEEHMQNVVHLLEVAYTRSMVPRAIYNECTNFIPSLSFSHDSIVNRLDREKCRKATMNFAKRWNYGKADWMYGAKRWEEPMDFLGFCHDICEMRYGKDSPKCLEKQWAGEKPLGELGRN